MSLLTFSRRAMRTGVAGLSMVAIAALYLVPMGPAAADPVGPANITPPALSEDLAVVGTAITTDDGMWSGNGAISYDYDWQTCDADGSSNCASTGDVDNSYTPVNGDMDKTLQAVVTATDDDGS